MNNSHITWGNGVLELILCFDAGHPVSIAHVGAPGSGRALPELIEADGITSSAVHQRLEPQPLVEILAAGSGHLRASDRLVHSEIGARLRLLSHSSSTNEHGWANLDLVQHDAESGLVVTTRLVMPPGVSAVRGTVALDLTGSRTLTIEAIALSLMLGITPEQIDKADVVFARNDWLAEGRWRREPLRDHLPAIDLALHHADPKGAFTELSSGTWSTGSASPSGFVVDRATNATWGWQVETNGAWRWEVGERRDGLYLALSGPTAQNHQWSQRIEVGSEIATVPFTLVYSATGFEHAVAQLTNYRRLARRDHPDNFSLPVVFNDYMNTLMGDPTTEKLLPLIDAAALAGCEVFVIDAGWYDDGGDWWDSVGEWKPSAVRFPGGFNEVLDRIRDRGMKPGVWLEPEVVGVRSPIVDELPDSAFLERGGVRVTEHERFHLDLRDAAARAHLDRVVDHLVDDMGVGYIKLDYNINAGPGTEWSADSVGSGLLEHNRAHLAWLDRLLDRHPDLVLENCASGAMRQDFALLSRLQVQSTSDQQSLQRYAPIAASAPMSMPPEQAANWAYPQAGMAREEATFTLVTSMLGRFYLSGYLNRMSQGERRLVAEAVHAHRSLRREIRGGYPSWPIGLPGWDDSWIALGITGDESLLLSVWRRGGEDRVQIPLPDFAGQGVRVEPIFPVAESGLEALWNPVLNVLTVEASSDITARVFRIARRADLSPVTA